MGSRERLLEDLGVEGKPRVATMQNMLGQGFKTEICAKFK